MFKKLKDKLAEEVKSSPQRIQQFAQAAQAAVTSASSSISDITNSDLFSIGDNDSQTNRSFKPSSSSPSNTLQDVSLVQPATMQSESEPADFLSNHEENQRQRRLSNSSLASDVSFRLPSYESPSMYHLQSDMEVSASEAEERAISSGPISLDRVTKEQLYTAYRRTQDKYKKYRTQYADLARHYKLLERENAKARNVLVETQDKALRRISELREQCSLEQSAKAHLEKALRVEIEERNMKIETLETKISILQSNDPNSGDKTKDSSDKLDEKDSEVQLINLLTDDENKPGRHTFNDVTVLNSKLEKMEQLLNKYKESLKTAKEKNSQLSTDIKLLSTELESKSKENEEFKKTSALFAEAQKKIQDLSNMNEELQNKINTYDFNKTKEVSTLETDLQKCYEEIAQLRSKVEVFSKREEEYAISLAENKLSIHKELESKEAEIKTLKDNLTSAKNELQSLNIILTDYKSSVMNLEEERLNLKKEISELNTAKMKVTEMESQIQDFVQKCQSLEQINAKAEEEYKCLDLQMTQETAEKMAIIDRNCYLEDKISKLTEENTKKNKKISKLENELKSLKDIENQNKDQSEAELWKSKFNVLENEIQEERVELIKLQTEIEKLLANHELVQQQNLQLNNEVLALKEEKCMWQQKVAKIQDRLVWRKLLNEVKELQNDAKIIFKETESFQKQLNNEFIPEIRKNISKISDVSDTFVNINNKYNKLEKDYLALQNESENVKEEYRDNSQKLISLQCENNSLKTQIQTNESIILALKQEIQTLTVKYNESLNETNIFKNENQKLIAKVQDVDAVYNRLQDNVDHDKTQYLAALDKLKVVEDKKQTLQKRINNIEKENESLNIELEKLKALYNDENVRFNTIKAEKEEILSEIKEKDLTISRLDQTTQLLSQENITLKKQCESIANSLKDLEIEINEVRRSHADIETEKDRLNSVIEELEKRENEKSNKCTTKIIEVQTELNIQSDNLEKDKENENLKNKIDFLRLKNSEYENEIHTLKESNLDLENKLNVLNALNKNNDSNELNEYNNLRIDYNLLKEENRRLQSDIEGLQTYLTKISKENGILNDKIRELIASSENLGRSELHVGDICEIRNEVTSNKEKIEDLLRENNLLIEENLELKDQLQSQAYVKPKEPSNNNESDYIPLDKYNSLLMSKNTLEEKLIDLEQMNKSANSNIQQIQSNNDKLRLTNEKLERRLDEALVSLRHLHSLQENTELEYLRNILYEYLTGTGAHSITLAKVLAAIVKFDDKQTQQVLQKEKERQGILRQLGLM